MANLGAMQPSTRRRDRPQSAQQASFAAHFVHTRTASSPSLEYRGDDDDDDDALRSEMEDDASEADVEAAEVWRDAT